MLGRKGTSESERKRKNFAENDYNGNVYGVKIELYVRIAVATTKTTTC